MDVKALISAMLAAVKGHASDAKNYLKARVKLIAEGVAAIAADRLSGTIDDDGVRFAFEQIRESEETAVLALEATAQAAAQDAINAALSIAATAINKAAGIAIL